MLRKAEEETFIDEFKKYAVERKKEKIMQDDLESLLLEYCEASGFQYVKMPEIKAEY
jgi:hypothetical protein